MNRFLKLAFATLFVCTPGQLWAGVFSRDWKTPGDGLLTYDDQSRREWLDVPQSLLSQFPGATLEDRYQKAILQIAPGGLYEGFLVANIRDVTMLADSAGIVTSTENYATNHIATRRLISLLGETINDSIGEVYTGGFLNEVIGSPNTGRVISLFTHHTAPQFGFAGLRFIGIGDDFVLTSTIGLMMYRPVPEGESFAMAVFSILIILSYRFSYIGRS